MIELKPTGFTPTQKLVRAEILPGPELEQASKIFAEKMARLQTELIAEFHATIENIVERKLSILGHTFKNPKSKEAFYKNRLTVVQKPGGDHYLYLDIRTDRIFLLMFNPQKVEIYD